MIRLSSHPRRRHVSVKHRDGDVVVEVVARAAFFLLPATNCVTNVAEAVVHRIQYCVLAVLLYHLKKLVDAQPSKREVVHSHPNPVVLVNSVFEPRET